MTDFWQYNFPPFFTIQPNDETRRLQMDAWCDLILDHCRRNRIFSLNIGECLTRAPFRNDSISRSLSEESLVTILADMVKRGRAEWVRSESESRTSKKKDKDENGENSNCLIYWLKPDEWAKVVQKSVDSKALSGTICTFYELTEDDRADEVLRGLDERILLKALRVLEQQAKCTVMKMDNSYGVKFV